MAKKSQPTSSNSKFIRVFEYDEATTIWTYDYSVTKNGPVSVEVKYKNEPKAKKRKTKKQVI
jgi:hypothetical protein